MYVLNVFMYLMYVFNLYMYLMYLCMYLMYVLTVCMYLLYSKKYISGWEKEVWKHWLVDVILVLLVLIAGCIYEPNDKLSEHQKMTLMQNVPINKKNIKNNRDVRAWWNGISQNHRLQHIHSLKFFFLYPVVL